jgi:hypothetical protein
MGLWECLSDKQIGVGPPGSALIVLSLDLSPGSLAQGLAEPGILEQAL